MRALLALGLVQVHEQERHVVLCRGAAVLYPIPKIDPVPVYIQRLILTTFSITEADFLAQLRPN